jgi:hypothetical protein
MKSYKHITIRQVGGEIFEQHPVYRIFDNKDKKQLGILSFYRPWKKYVFCSKDGCVFDTSCLSDVQDFIKTVIENGITPVPELNIPDPYQGILNEKRIKEYKRLTGLYNLQPGTIRDIFSAGVDWFIEVLKKQ